ncbi:MAG: Stk1 family PASTA domain-containing Ser/Thr kinase, partial [Stomatobaculum sp.]|nr:Stk1 family PASTA domain-containing Ser/Thr kinase [Stomatobaculum sp.]
MLRHGVFLQNRYEILELIGSGGMSEVYRARCHKLNRFVAIKLLKKEFCQDEEFVRKFKMEAQAAAGLNHPNIVSIYDVVDEDDLHYIVMELVEGITLKDYITKKGHLDIKETIGIAVQVAQGIGAAHQRGIIHRDVKPQNMILAGDGKVKVADFGIARAVTAQTINSQAMGSVHYISPEQARGEFTDARSDIYSLGITMYEMVTGRLPFDGDTAVAVALAHIEESLIPPETYNPAIPKSLEQIIIKCAEKEPENRYQDIDSVIRDLMQAAEEPDVIPQGVSGGLSGDTREINKKELKERLRNAQGSSRRKNSRSRQAKEEKEDENLDHMLKITGIVFAAALIGAVVFMMSFFRSPAPPETQAAVTTEAESSESAQALSDKEVFMPYVIGLSQEDAEKKLAESDLTLTISSREHSEQFAENLVMDQSPAPGDVTPKFTKVSVTLSLGTAKIDLNTYSLIAMKAEDAEAMLTEEGFQVVKKEEYSETDAAGTVMDFSPERAEKGESILLKVSLGPEVTYTNVPNLTGKTEEAAKAELAAAGLKAGKMSKVYSDTVPEGTVITQAVDAGDQIESGTGIGFTISLGPEETTPAETDFMVEPIGGDTNSRYVASINNTYELKNLVGPGSASSTVSVMIRLRQEVAGQTVFKTLMEPRTVTADTILPVRFKAIEGAYGVDTGYVEVVLSEQDQVLKSYEVQFFKV